MRQRVTAAEAPAFTCSFNAFGSRTQAPFKRRSRFFQRRKFNHVIISWNGIFPGN
jgi:hypothetical protein